MNIELAQIKTKAGDPEYNVAKMVEVISKSNADLIAFPEMAVSGYLLGDLWTSEEQCAWFESFNEVLRQASLKFQKTIVFGNVYRKLNECNKDGRIRKFNAAYVYENGVSPGRAKENEHIARGVQPKTLLPNYRFFDDERYFLSLADAAIDYGVDISTLIQPFRLKNGMLLGIQLCEDMWCEDYKVNGSPFNTAAILKDNGANFIVNLSSSPWTCGKNNARDRRVKSLNCGLPYFYVNRIGAENCGDNIVIYDGGTTVYNADGEPVVIAESNVENQTFVNLELIDDMVTINRKEASNIEQKYLALRAGLRHIQDWIGKVPKFVIGLSGGVDSAVSACLIEREFGKDALFAVNMPTKHNSAKTQTNALHIANKLSIQYTVAPIGDIVDVARNVIDDAVKGIETGNVSLAHENESARIRGSIILSGIAARIGGVYTNNGNKLETALGYATLYGDVNGVVALLGDLTKVEVIEMVKYLNNEVYKDEVIPWNLVPDELWRFNKDAVAPSAELKDDQVDPMKFGYHDALLEAFLNFKKCAPETILEKYLLGEVEFSKFLNINPLLIERYELNNRKLFIEDLEWFCKLFFGNVFKRVQAPPVIITSKTAFGYDLRESIGVFKFSKRYNELKLLFV